MLSLFASVKFIHKINAVGFWSLAGCIMMGQFIVMCFLNVILVIGIVLDLRVILFVGLFFGMEGVLSKTELVLVEIFHPVLVFCEGFGPHFLHRGVVFACLLMLAKVESVGRLGFLLVGIGIILMGIGVILGVWVSMMGGDFGVELVFVRLRVFFSGFELAGLKLVNPDPRCLQLKYPLGMWVLLIAVKDVCECLIEIFWRLIGSFLEGGEVIGAIDDGVVRVDIAVDEVVIAGVGGRELLVLVDFEEGGEFHCCWKGMDSIADELECKLLTNILM